MTPDRTLEKLVEGVRLAKEATRQVPGEWEHIRTPFQDVAIGGCSLDIETPVLAAFIAHCNPEFVLEVAREVERLRGVEEAAKDFLKLDVPRHQFVYESEYVERLHQAVEGAALANPAAEAGE